MKKSALLPGVLCLLAAGRLAAAEYFVSPDGRDAADGLSRAAAFQTVQRGVDALAEGDTLTIAPGEYFEGVFRQGLGGPDRETAIRAEIPGTVLLRGDVPVSGFRPVPGFRYIYALDFDREVRAVNEADTGRVLRREANLAELEFTPGRCCYDASAKRLYISTSDMRPPEGRRYTASVLGTHGFYLLEPKRVVVEGLAATGFYADEVQGRSFPGSGLTWGFVLGEPNDCVIRDCTSFLNAAGIALHRRDISSGNLVERCRVWGNPDAGLVGYAADGWEIRESQAWRNGYIGIGYYGAGIRGPAILRDNLAWSNTLADLRVKGGDGPRVGLAENCVALGNLDISILRDCTIGWTNVYNRTPERDNIMLAEEADLDPDAEFADPANLDFRLQAASRFRGAGPDGADRGPFPYRMNIFYLDPAGDDAADGLSAAGAWRTLPRALAILRPGDTLYLAPGSYDAPAFIRAGEPGAGGIHIRGRGLEPAMIRGALNITGSAGLVFERLNLCGPVTIEKSPGIEFDDCRFGGPETALKAESSDGLRVTHSVFLSFSAAALRLAGGAGAFVSGNIFDNPPGVAALELDRPGALIYSDYNGYNDRASAWLVGGQARPAGPPAPHERYARTAFEPGAAGEIGDPGLFAGAGPLGRDLGFHRDFQPRAVRVDAPVVHSADDTSANLEWHSSGPVTCEVGWGSAPDALERRETVSGSGFTSFSITGLAPGRRYYFAVLSAAVEHLDAMVPTEATFERAPVAFETAAVPRAPATWYVAPDGDDGRDGRARDRAWRTVARAAAAAGAGDTVLIAGGVYSETVRVRATGTPGRPVTFRALPGEKVVFDGNRRLLSSAFLLKWKHHVRLDGLYFRQFGSGKWGEIGLYRSDHARITRCFKTGLGAGYPTRFVYAQHCAGLAIENCAIVSGFEGLVVHGCSDLRIENSVLLRNFIQAMIIENNPGQKMSLNNNIITDSLPGKVGVTLLEFARVESLIEENNCYLLRVPDEERKPFWFYGNLEFERAARAYGVEVVYPEPPLITELTRMSLAEYRRRFAPGSRSFVGDPKFRAAQGLDAGGFIADRLAGLAELDFPGLFATDPEVVGRGIGLRPEAFADFHFNR